ncbi:FAD-binding oxidoreductase [Streptomyces sp. NPDC017943]|uniref:FAD-binding oxidoreductase n=1 Tax=Streptomyces sp. NPDC017943 TaxID=3365019 RepID=UPI0037B32E48
MQNTVPAQAITDLVREVAGSVYVPGDEGYAREIAGFNLRSTHEPLLVVAAAHTGDVQAAVSFAAAHQLPVGVKNTGHQPFPAQEGFVLITVGAMRSVAIDADRAVARVGGGARWADVVGPAQEVGLAPLNGSAPHVGVVGYTLGGGLSPLLGRVHGWAVDHVVSIEVVTADGRVRRVARDEEPELFRVLCGGRSNFGVVTEIEFGLFPLSSFYGGGIYLPGHTAEDVLRTFAELSRQPLPEGFNCSVALLNLPPLPELPEPFRGKFLAHVRVSHLGTDAEAEALIAPFRALGPALVDTVSRQPYSAFAAVHADPVDPAPYEESSALLASLPDEAVDRLAAFARTAAGGPVTVLELRQLGGALNAMPAHAVPLAARQAGFIVWGATVGPPPIVASGELALRTLLDELSPWSTGLLYTNFTGREDQAEDTFDVDTLADLREAKRRFDPQNLFRVNNHNVDPQ